MINDFSAVEVHMDYEHYRLHTGETFFWSERLSAQTGTLRYLLRTGALPVHINLQLTASVATDIDIIEGVTTTVVGTAMSLFNYNRTSAKTPAALLYKGPTATGGTTIRQSRAGSGTTPGQGVTSASGIGLEYILKPNTDYIFQHVPSASADLLYMAFFYEMATRKGV